MEQPRRSTDRVIGTQITRSPPSAASHSSHRKRWKSLFGADFDVLLYDLTSTYCESDPPFPEEDKRKFGYSRDKRSDCVQVVVALIVTPEGFPLAYEVMAGSSDRRGRFFRPPL